MCSFWRHGGLTLFWSWTHLVVGVAHEQHPIEATTTLYLGPLAVSYWRFRR